MTSDRPSFSEVKAFFIDFDGTLVNTIPLLNNVYYQFLSSRGHQGNEEEFEFLNGQKLTEIIAFIKEKYALEEGDVELKNAYEKLIRERFYVELELFPGARKFLDKALNYGKIYIVSSTIKDLLLSCIESLDLLSIVEDILSGDDISEGKPHPEIYLKALNLADVSPNEAVVFEDSDNGVEAALAAGIPTIFMHRKEAPFTKRALYSAENWDEARKWLGEGV